MAQGQSVMSLNLVYLLALSIVCGLTTGLAAFGVKRAHLRPKTKSPVSIANATKRLAVCRSVRSVFWSIRLSEL